MTPLCPTRLPGTWSSSVFRRATSPARWPFLLMVAGLVLLMSNYDVRLVKKSAGPLSLFPVYFDTAPETVGDDVAYRDQRWQNFTHENTADKSLSVNVVASPMDGANSTDKKEKSPAKDRGNGDQLPVKPAANKERRSARISANHDESPAKSASVQKQVSQVRRCTPEERRVHMLQYCHRHGYKAPQNRRYKLAKRSIVDFDYQLVYCPISKVASTTWKYFLLHQRRANRTSSIVHDRRFQSKFGLHGPTFFSSEQQQDIKDKFLKFIVVRHPLTRIVSVWRDKLVNRKKRTEDYHKSTLGVMAQRMLEKYRVTPDNSPEWNKTVKFEEFAEFLMQEKINEKHWVRYAVECNLCAVPYDIIMRTETMAPDAQPVLQRISNIVNNNSTTRQGDDLTLPLVHSFGPEPGHETETVTSQNVHLSEYAKVSEQAMDFLLKKYEGDMEMFGYTWDRKKQTAVCEILTASGDVCC